MCDRSVHFKSLMRCGSFFTALMNEQRNTLPAHQSSGGCLCLRRWIFSFNSINAPTFIYQPQASLPPPRLPPAISPLPRSSLHLACKTVSLLSACARACVFFSPMYFDLFFIASLLPLTVFINHFVTDTYTSD